jgi:predicted nuclease of restriction endonuclease-like RecB superfamily
MRRRRQTKKMLTSDLAVSWRRGNRTGPRCLDVADERHLRVAEDLISLVTQYQSCSRGGLEAAFDDYVGAGTDYRVLRGLLKLLFDLCVFETSSPVAPAEIRRTLFFKARVNHPVLADSVVDGVSVRHRIIDETAREVNCEPEAVIDGLYADLNENQILVGFEAISARQLLDRYNLAQAQALLYRCVAMTLWIEPQEPAGYRRLFEAIKAYRLIHHLSGNQSRGYEVRLDGPVSMFHRSQKYGIQMSVFLPALLAQQGWRMRAEIAVKGRDNLLFELDSRQTELRSDDWHQGYENSASLEKIMAGWKSLAGAASWQVRACREVIDLGDSALVPDLVFEHQDGRQFYFEMLGFWTPRWLNERVQTCARHGVTNYLIGASEELRCSREAPTNLPPQVIIKRTVTAREILTTIEKLTEPTV